MLPEFWFASFCKQCLVRVSRFRCLFLSNKSSGTPKTSIYHGVCIKRWFKWGHCMTSKTPYTLFLWICMALQILSFRNKISSSPRWLRRRITLPALISWWKLSNMHTSSLITSRTNVFTHFFMHKGLRGCFLSFLAEPVAAKQCGQSQWRANACKSDVQSFHGVNLTFTAN